MFNNYRKSYDARMACALVCYKLDIPFYHSLYESVLQNNDNVFSIGQYIRQMNRIQYQYQSFVQTLVNNELHKSTNDVEIEKELKWTPEELRNRDEVIEIIGYDPFEGYLNNDRKFLFSELIKYFDEDISDDTYKLSQVIQIVNNNNQIRRYDLLISSLNPLGNNNEIKSLNGLKKDLVSSNDKMAKENEISVKNRSNKEIGKSTLTYLMRDLREKNFEKVEVDYYDQLRSEGTLWAIEMSNRAIKQNGMFDENDKQELFDIQKNLIENLQKKLDDEMEKNRLLNIQLDISRFGDKNE